MKISSYIRNYLSEIGSKGGKATGRKKRRPTGHYKRIGRLGGKSTQRKR